MKVKISVAVVTFCISLFLYPTPYTSSILGSLGVKDLNPVYAASATPSASLEQLSNDLPDPGRVEIGSSQITAASPLYFLKAIREKIELMFAQNKDQKLKVMLEFSQRRLREATSLIKTNHQDLIEATVERYKDLIIDEDSLVSDSTSKVEIAQDLTRHLDILQRLYADASLPRARISLMSAIEKVVEYNSHQLNDLDLTSQQKLVGKIALRQILACKFMAQEASSSATSEPQKQLLGQEIQTCQKDAQTILKDQLDQLRKKAVENPQANKF